MSEGPIIAVRFGLFAIEGLLLGVPLFGLYALRAPERSQLPFRAWLILLSLIGVGLNILGFALLLASMAGTSINAIDPDLARSILLTAPVGWAFVLRLAVTVLALGLVLLAPANRTSMLASVTAFSSVALASLAWNGHGVATEGVLAWPHLLADIVHLLAAGVWLGAIACLLYMVVRPKASLTDLTIAGRCLKEFGVAGSMVVALLIATGLINGFAILGNQPFGPAFGSAYIVLMGSKLALFALMLALAALHRFRLVPAVESATDHADKAMAVRRIRSSMAVELAAAVVILGLVAWLGTLEPGW
ncbi:putative copper resistance protein D [Novosphingobium hassiacum]|uniref:Putative copper resistance protein D n=1 Tax=Novosphingobium hassiacum TaxID=173676 RepID=A0A7W5ZXZ5_9SPHN|nr:copper homeostasis membrane protein CopD [Novosphingobium hassiacum]MBB3862026.1 putative copper resistance protein D [Novosphingobium hassiacum]